MSAGLLEGVVARLGGGSALGAWPMMSRDA